MFWTLIGYLVVAVIFTGLMWLALTIGWVLCERTWKQRFMDEKRAAVAYTKRTETAAVYRDIAKVVEGIITDTDEHPDAYDSLFAYTEKLKKEALRLTAEQ